MLTMVLMLVCFNTPYCIVPCSTGSDQNLNEAAVFQTRWTISRPQSLAMLTKNWLADMQKVCTKCCCGGHLTAADCTTPPDSHNRQLYMVGQFEATQACLGTRRMKTASVAEAALLPSAGLAPSSPRAVAAQRAPCW